MRTIADKYIDEGIAQGMQIGEAKGLQIGRNEGKHERTIEVAKNMLSNNYSIPEVSCIAGLSIFKLNTLLNAKS